MIVTPETPGAMHATVIDRATKETVMNVVWADTNTGKAKTFLMKDGRPQPTEEGTELAVVDYPGTVDVYIPKEFERYYISDEPIGVNPYRELPS